jgi:regulatory protein YycI of two-component signal transduction system YycFG
VNWETAKSWLIVAFFILDVVLGWQFIESRREMSGYAESETDLLANTRTLLAEHGFSLDTEVPSVHDALPLLAANYASVPLLKLVPTAFHGEKTAELQPLMGTAVTADGKIQVVDDGRWQVQYIHPVSWNDSKGKVPPSFIWRPGDYIRDSASDLPTTIRYVRKYQNYPIFDAAVEIHVTGNRVYSYTQTAIDNIHAVGPSQPIISAIDALTSLANSVDKTNEPDDNKIRYITLGYKQKIAVNPESDGQETDNYWFPVWRIVTGSQEYFINAFTGEVSSND